MLFSRLFTSHATARQSAALPVLVTADGHPTIGLVTSRDSHRWVLPKGWVEAGVPANVTAATEAREEGGLVGDIAAEPLGSYTYRKRLHLLASLVCEVDVFLLRVERRLDKWPEQHQRRVAFFDPATAAGLVHEPGLADILRRPLPDRLE